MYNMTSDLGLPSFEEVLEDCEKGANALLICSGGLDSGYTLWKYKQAVGDRVASVHHFRLFDSQDIKRNEAQTKALYNQAAYLGNVDIETTTIDTSFDKYLLRHWFIGAFLSPMLAQVRDAKYIVIGDDLPDSYYRAQPYSSMKKQYRDSTIALSKFINSYTDNRVQLCTASKTNDLSVAYMEMPEDYQRLLFSCSNPIETEDEYKVCWQCGACYKNMHFGWFDRVAMTVRKE